MGVYSLQVWTTLLALAHFTLADISLFFEGLTTDNVISTGCQQALVANITTCDGSFTYFPNFDYQGPFLNSTAQNLFCSEECSTAFAEYHNNIIEACSKDPQPWEGIPATFGGDRLWAYQNRTCLVDPATGSYCNEVIANWTLPDYDVAFQDLPKDYLCSDCYLNLLHQIQSTPFSNYDESFITNYTLAQSVCGVNYPTTVQPWPLNVTQYFPPGLTYPDVNSTICLSGNTYTVASGDTCQSIANAKSVGTGALRVINSIFPDCSNLATGAVLCLPNACTTYLVQTNDTCWSIATTYATTATNIIGYNPTLNNECDNLNVGENICMAPASGNYTPTTIPGATATQTSIYATTSVTAPGPVAFDTTSECGRYYAAQSGDDCGQISQNNTISVALFEEINPSINAGCTNLVVGLYYCVFPMANWNSTSTSTATGSVTVSAPAPTNSGTTSSCYQWYTVVPNDNCGLIESSFNITFSQFQQWNPSVNSACTNIIAGDAYCVNGGTASVTTTTSLSTSKTTTSTSTTTTSTTKPISTNGLCGTSFTCTGSAFGTCCSTSGYCGSTSAYCAAASCDKTAGTCDQPISSDGTCGATYAANATCTGSQFGTCCSTSGFCGSTSAYCAATSCDKTAGNCDQAISSDGTCGPTYAANATCTGSTFGICCSNYGFCGSTSDYCSKANCYSGACSSS